MSPLSKEGLNAFKKIVLSTHDGYIPINPEDILYCKASDSYTYIFMKEGYQYIMSHGLKEYEEMLRPYNFFRIHRSYLININHINRINKQDGFVVLMSDGSSLSVSNRKREEFISFIRNT